MLFYTSSAYDTSSPQTYKNNICINSISKITEYTKFKYAGLNEYLYNKIKENQNNVKPLAQKYKVCAFNVHKFSQDRELGCRDDLVVQQLPKWKKLFNEEINADFLMINEWSDKFDRKKTIDTYNEIFKQFYPYKYVISNDQCFMSRVPCEFEVITLGIKLIKAKITGTNIYFVVWVQSNTYPSSRRIEKYKELLEKHIPESSRAIIGGDYNNDNGRCEELQIFKDKGFTLGNCGYWGSIKTIDATTTDFLAIDNIITKGLILNSFKVLNNKVDSDHYPVVSEIII